MLSGKALSYNNLLDLDAAWRAAVSFERPAVCIMKHLSPCGLACAKELALAFQDALASDPVSAFGGVIAVNHLFDEDTANALGDLFVECIVAPGYSPGALAVLASRKNLRIVRMPDTGLAPLYELRSVNQGVLRQSIDLGDPDETEWRVVSQRAPTEDEWQSLRFAWKACQHVKSNAIVFARGEATVGIGGGQPNRVDCVRIAAQRAEGKVSRRCHGIGRLFPFPRFSRRSRQGRRQRYHFTGWLGARCSSHRGSRQKSHVYGIHRCAPFPPLSDTIVSIYGSLTK